MILGVEILTSPLTEPRFLINHDGSPFGDNELEEIRDALLSLRDAGVHLDYRDRNSASIAHDPSPSLLIVSGPGTGKSHLFIDRIKYWLSDSEGEILVTSFVRKLVQELHDDVSKLSEDQRSRVTTTTLHSLARSILEKNLGTADWKFRPHIQMIGEEWQPIVWADVHEFHPDIDRKSYPWDYFVLQLYNAEESDDPNWQALRNTYFRLTQFYNAVGFQDLITRASIALAENDELNKYQYFIIDEYQDFNRSEEVLLIRLAGKAKGLLIVGDDDQVLYAGLKQGKAELLRGLYQHTRFTNALLPFCGRCNYYIVKAADAFIGGNSNSERIHKIFLPCDTHETCERISIVVCAQPTGVVDYVERFINEHKVEIEQRARDLDAGTVKDAFLLLLSPARDAVFLGKHADKLKSVVGEYVSERRVLSQSVYRLLDLYSVGKNPSDNYAFRKVLHASGLSPQECHPYIMQAMGSGSVLAEMDVASFKKALGLGRAISELVDSDLEKEEKIAGLARRVAVDDETAEIVIDLLQQRQQLSVSDSESETDPGSIEVTRANAIDLMTIVGSKGLSADHVIVLGCDDRNMSYVSREAFFVAMTRARKSLHLVTGLQCGGSRLQHEYLDEIPEDCVGYCKHTKGSGREELSGRRDFCNYINRIDYARSQAKR